MTSLAATSLAAQIASRRPLAGPVALIAAHPDDETIGAGIAMRLFGGLLLVHVTDGAPRDLHDARIHGYADAASYAAARRDELAAALKVGGITAHCVSLAAPDLQAAHNMPALAGRLADLLLAHQARVLVTHAFEGGHPDHDATSLIVHLAARALPARPAILEMASYNAHGVGTFLPDGPEVEILALTEAEQARKRAMFAAHASQTLVLSQFGVQQEPFRMAPAHDFLCRPHEGHLHYEHQDWGLDFTHWQHLAAACL